METEFRLTVGRALDELGMAGVAMNTTVLGRALVEPGFEPQLPTYFVVCTNGVVCVLGADGEVAGLDPRTGRPIWRYSPPVSAGFAAGAAADNGVLYVAEISPRGVTALDVRTGRPRWTTPTPSVASTLLVLGTVPPSVPSPTVTAPRSLDVRDPPDAVCPERGVR
jgi:outer membrane protein assembly factor BamB